MIMMQEWAVGGYPSGYVNRGAEVDPSDFELEFIKRLQVQFQLPSMERQFL